MSAHDPTTRVRRIAALAFALTVAVTATSAASPSASSLRPNGAFARTETGLAGVEPGAQFLDASGRTLLVYGLQGQTAGAGDLFGASSDGGKSFATSRNGVQNSGNDMDVARGPDGHLMLVDLTQPVLTLGVCVSSDNAKTWQSPLAGSCTQGAPVVTGAVADRPWILSDGQPGGYWVLFDDLVLGVDILLHTSNNGRTFQTCTPAPVASAPYTMTSSQLGGLYTGRPVIDAAGALHWTVQVYPAQPEAFVAGTTQHATSLYAITYRGGCSDGAWAANQIYRDDAAALNGAVTAMARDASGTLYAVFSGKISASSPSGAWLFTGPHDGANWSAPKLVSPAGRDISRPTVAALGTGRIAIGYYGSTNSAHLTEDPEATWCYFVGLSRDSGRHVTTYDVSGPLFETGDPAAHRVRDIIADTATVLINPRTGFVTAVYDRGPRNDVPSDVTPDHGLITVARQQHGVSLR